MKKVIRVWDVCHIVRFRDEYAYSSVEADTEEEAIAKIDLGVIDESALFPEIDSMEFSHIDLEDEYEIEEDDD